MKKIIAVILMLWAMPVLADGSIYSFFDKSFHAVKDPATAELGEVTGYSDIFYEYDPVHKTLVVSKTEWISDGKGHEYPSPNDLVLYYSNVTFDNMCETVGHCNDVVEKKITEIRTEYEKNVDNSVNDNFDTEQNNPEHIDAALQKAKAYVDEQNAIALKEAKDYTDKKVNALEKELSSGIATASAMSAIEISNVRKGEVSVGGGYGYYNSQSAVAFGAAMGLTDNWSANAAAGVADSNISFRAGTNYKFKLF